jgi:glycosyltransferase involved in cell wall biosynthesis
MDALDTLRVVLVHDWLTGMRGGEKVLEVFCRRWPRACLYTLLHKKGSTSAAIEALKPRTSFLRFFPAVHRYYRYLLPLMPRAVRWRLPECDLVLSSSHCVAKGVSVPPGMTHVCYCHTPMRYAWHMQSAYFKGGKRRGVKRWLVDRLMARMRAWDRRTADGVTHFIANSRVVQQRILDCYGRTSEVIHPPVDTAYYCPAPVPREDFYLVMSAFAPYKRLDLAVEACNLLKRHLVVIGSGQDDRKLRHLAGPTTQFLGWQPDEAVRDHLRRCRALLFPGEEDFGIVPVEAQACGTPVIAFGRGGATETIVPLHHGDAEPTGVWFDEQTPACLAASIEMFEKHQDDFNPRTLRLHALEWSGERFESETFDYLAKIVVGTSAMRRAA